MTVSEQLINHHKNSWIFTTEFKVYLICMFMYNIYYIYKQYCIIYFIFIYVTFVYIIRYVHLIYLSYYIFYIYRYSPC